MYSVLAQIGLAGLASAAAIHPRQSSGTANSTYYNPILPGYHSDPSCAFVPELNGTFFCTSSTFGTWPGHPIYASKDLVNWKLVSNALNRAEQIPAFNTLPTPGFGMFAPTLRYHNGTLYLITFDVEAGPAGGLLFETTDPYSDAAWSVPSVRNVSGIDPDIFWDTDGSVHFASTAARFDPSGIGLNSINLTTEENTGFQYIWNGTGGASPEGPHLYSKDGYYYLLIAEGGTEKYHEVDIARSKNITGPYESCPSNPVLTNANTTRYFQSVGHADIFQDASSNWWAVALARRSGPEYVYAPMARETVLTPVTWSSEGWPIMSVVEGNMTGPLPPADRNGVNHTGVFIDADDDYTFASGSALPQHFCFYGIPDYSNYVVSPSGHDNTLALTAIANATIPGLSFIGRRQTDTLFTYKVSMTPALEISGDEAGVSVYTDFAHRIDMGVSTVNGSSQVFFRPLNATEETSPAPQYQSLQNASATIDFEIKALNQTTYSFSATSSGSTLLTAYASSVIVSQDFIGRCLSIQEC